MAGAGSPSTSSNHPQLTPAEIAMMILSFVAVLVVLTMTFGKLDEETYQLLFYLDTGICLVFQVKFFSGLFSADSKREYLKRNWIDFVASIPAVEELRFARIFQILRVIRLIRVSRSVLIPLLRQRTQTGAMGLLLATVVLISLSSILILLVEGGHPDSNINTAEEAIWWAFVTISTVGYGDYYPSTGAGRLLGGLVIIGGVGFFGVVSGYVASMFVAPDQEETVEASEARTRAELEKILAEMEDNQDAMRANQRKMEANQKQIQGQLDEIKALLQSRD
ncbi:ion transporter [Paraferrimonas sedimenticola]|uniref:Ion transporter n=1 Tax=Paraferrimonas sedimenticola TaxID=375674 RepID=A0AA37RUZ5_9GAMM|nr:ion transporter [Paraferrimonas sedimenticola]GLP95678.1 ion transporter [Paraferrimonas sedimenticola]